jgi:hypothetical protein
MPLFCTFVGIRSNCRIGYTCVEKRSVRCAAKCSFVNRVFPQPNLATFASPVTCCGVLTRSRHTPRYANCGVKCRDVWI